MGPAILRIFNARAMSSYDSDVARQTWIGKLSEFHLLTQLHAAIPARDWQRPVRIGQPARVTFLVAELSAPNPVADEVRKLEHPEMGADILECLTT